MRTFLQLGRIGDILNILPALRGESIRTGQSTPLVVDVGYAALLEGCSYVKPLRSPYQDWQAVQHAKSWAHRNGVQHMTITQVHGRGWRIARRAQCFAEDSRRLCAVPDEDWKEPIVFDNRDRDRESRLLNRIFGQAHIDKLVLYNLAGRSAPFAEADQLRQAIKDLCDGLGCVSLDLSTLEAERFYDLLALYERAAALITVDTATLHLAAATSALPVVSLLPNRDDRWNAAWEPLPTINVQARVLYPHWHGQFKAIASVVKAALSGNVESTVEKIDAPIAMASFLARRSEEGAAGKFPWSEVLSGNGLELWPAPGNVIDDPNITIFSHGKPGSVSIADTFPPGVFDFVHCGGSARDVHAHLRDWLAPVREGGHVVIVTKGRLQPQAFNSIRGIAAVRLNRTENDVTEIVLQKAGEQFGENYFSRGTATGLSNYDDYRWLPDLTIPVCRRMMDYLGAVPDDTVLDYGCARGYYVRALRELGYEAFGYDVSKWAVENGDTEIKNALSNVEPTSPVDWVLSKDVLEHIPKPALNAAVDRIISLAIQGALLIVPLAGEDGDFVSPRDRADISHVNCWPLDQWLCFVQAAVDRLGGEFIVSAGYKLPGVKAAADEWPKSCGFITLHRIEK